MPQISLAESLKRDANWEISNFGYNGPNNPYVRLGVKFNISRLEAVPVFECWIKDKIWGRTKLPIKNHLGRYEFLSVDPMAFEDAFGKEHAQPGRFPFGEELRVLEVHVDEIKIIIHRTGELLCMPTRALSVASMVWVH